MAKILLVEDNPLTAKGLQYLLEREKYQVVTANDMRTAREKLAENFDLILLDVGLPDGDGFALAKSLRDTARLDGTVLKSGAFGDGADKQSGAAMIFLTARDREEDIVRGLEIGADDYIVKPFHNRELLLRIQNVLRRKSPQSSNVLQRGDMRVDATTREVEWRGRKISLTALESRILAAMLEMPSQIVTREKLLDEIWAASGSIVNDNTVSVYIKRLREKLGAETIRTVKNLGYKIELNNEKQISETRRRDVAEENHAPAD